MKTKNFKFKVGDKVSFNPVSGSFALAEGIIEKITEFDIEIFVSLPGQPTHGTWLVGPEDVRALTNF